MDYPNRNKVNFSSILIFVSFVLTSSCACEFVTNEALIVNKPSIKINPAPRFVVNGESDTNSAGGLQSIYFEYKKSKTNELQSRFLDQNVQILSDNPDVSIILEAYCDPTGGNEYNLRLSKERGLYIKSYLVSKGIKSERILIKPVGSKSKASEISEVDFKNERRVNIIIHSVTPQDLVAPPDKVNQTKKSTSQEKPDLNNALTDISNTVTLLRAPAKLLLNGESDLFTAGDLQSIFFEYKKHKIVKEQREILDKNILFLKANPKISFALEVHSDPIGGDAYNSKLEEKRLNYIISYLHNHGISPQRISNKIIGPKPTSNSQNNLQINNSKQFYKTERRMNFVITDIP
ncbi:MAG: OmpA family protein [Rhizobacter sp.]|nr:OmpA family protein [Bacteriovorax sp.]